MTDLLCITCGYQLTGLKPDGPCPECGTPIEKSMGGDQLAAAEPAWLRKLARGQTLLSVGVKMSLISVVLIVIVPIGLAFLTFVGGSPLFAMVGVVMGLLALLVLIGQLITTVGIFMVTARDPRLTLTEPPVCARTVTRWSMVAVVVCFLLGQAAEFVLPTEMFALTMIVLMVLTVCSPTVTVVALLQHLSRLAERIPDTTLRNTSLRLGSTLAWLFPLTVLLISAPAIVRSMIGPTGSRPGMITMGASCVGLVFGVFLLIMMVRLSALMTAYRKAFAGCLTAVPANPPAPR